MRRWVIGLIAIGLLVAAWWWWWPKAPLLPAQGEPAPDWSVAPVQVLAAPGAQRLAIAGVVRDQRGAAVPNAQVFIAGSGQVALPHVRCAHCSDALLSCRAVASALAVDDALAHSYGALVAALTTTSDEHGAFRFEGLGEISFTVWAEASGLGVGINERAAPGERVEVVLPAPRQILGHLTTEQGAPVAGQVRAISRRSGVTSSVASGADGAFSLRGLGEGPFTVTASAPGFLPVKAAQVEAGGAELELVLPSPRSALVTLTHQGRPIDGMVEVMGDHLHRTLPTAGGSVRIERLWRAEVLITGHAGELASLPQSVRLEQPLTAVTVDLSAGVRVAVEVADEAGQPVSSPTVTVRTASGQMAVRRTLKTGELALLGPFAPGAYVLTGSAPGYQDVSLPMEIGLTEQRVEVTLPAAIEISGRVVDELGRMAPGVSVLVSPLGESVISDAAGAFRHPVPSAGLYTLQAHHSDWGGGEAKVSAPATDVELQLDRKASVEVTVEFEGRRVEGASAVLGQRLSSFRSDRPSGADGVVLMRGVPPGEYTLVVSHPDTLPSHPQPVVLFDGQTLRVVAQLASGTAIKGVVVDEASAPVVGATVTVVPRAVEAAVTDERGAFVLRPVRAKATYRLDVHARHITSAPQTVTSASPVRVVVRRLPKFRGRVLGRGKPLGFFRVAGEDVASADGRFEIALAPEEGRVVVPIDAPGFEPLVDTRPVAPDLGDFILKPTTPLAGRVVDGAGPVAGASVSCDGCERSTSTDAEGRFVLPMPASQREVLVTAKKGRASASKSTQVSSGPIELVLQPAVKLMGTAFLPSGDLAAGVEVQVLPIDHGESLSAVTGADGRYLVELAAGRYRVSLNALPYLSIAADPPAWVVDVRAPQTEVNIGPAPGMGQVAVRVQPTEGWGLWLVQSELSSVGNPPLELLRVGSSQFLYEPRVSRVVFGGLLPGRYTVVWGSFHRRDSHPPRMMPVVVPGAAEVDLTQ